MRFSIKKGVPCNLEVWNGCDVVLDARGLYFQKRSDVHTYMDEHLTAYRGEFLEYYLTQDGGCTLDLHLGYTIK